MKLLDICLLLVLLYGIRDGKSWTTPVREEYIRTMKYGWNLFSKFKYGKQPKPGDYPGVAKVRRLDKGVFHFCGGTLITLSHVLTSFWCLHDVNRYQILRRKGEVTVTAGTVYSYDYQGFHYDPDTESFTSDADGSQMRFVKEYLQSNKTRVYHVSEKWRRCEKFTLYNDLLLLVVDRPFIGNRYLRRADFWTFSWKEANKSLDFLQKPSTGTYCKILSFGYETYEPALTLVHVKVIRQRSCQNFACVEPDMDNWYRYYMCGYLFWDLGRICAVSELNAGPDGEAWPYEGELVLADDDRFGTTGDAMYCHGTYLFGVTSFKFQKNSEENSEELGRFYFPFILTRLDEIILFLQELNVRVKSKANLVVNSLLLIVMSSAINV